MDIAGGLGECKIDHPKELRTAFRRTILAMHKWTSTERTVEPTHASKTEPPGVEILVLLSTPTWAFMPKLIPRECLSWSGESPRRLI